jgi:hypothetical protein
VDALINGKYPSSTLASDLLRRYIGMLPKIEKLDALLTWKEHQV